MPGYTCDEFLTAFIGGLGCPTLDTLGSLDEDLATDQHDRHWHQRPAIPGRQYEASRGHVGDRVPPDRQRSLCA
jgi:hypothetical protein